MRHGGVARVGTRAAARACVLLSALALACSPRQVPSRTVIGTDIVSVGERHLPELDRARVDVRQDESGVLVRASRETWCQRVSVQETIVEHKVVRESLAQPAGVALVGSGVGVMAAGLLIGQEAKDDPEDAPAGNWAALLVLTGVVVAFAGGMVLVASSGSEEHYRERVVMPVPNPPVVACGQPPPVPARVDLALPDGTLLRGEHSPTGLWRMRLDEPSWDKLGDRIDVDVLVDGVPMRRTILTRSRR